MKVISCLKENVHLCGTFWILEMVISQSREMLGVMPWLEILKEIGDQDSYKILRSGILITNILSKMVKWKLLQKRFSDSRACFLK